MTERTAKRIGIGLRMVTWFVLTIWTAASVHQLPVAIACYLYFWGRLSKDIDDWFRIGRAA